MSASTPFRITPAAEVISTELLDNELILLHMHTGEYYTLNESGATIWQGIQQQQSIATICHMLVERYDVTDEAAEPYVSQLIRDLAEEQLVTVGQ